MKKATLNRKKGTNKAIAIQPPTRIAIYKLVVSSARIKKTYAANWLDRRNREILIESSLHGGSTKPGILGYWKVLKAKLMVANTININDWFLGRACGKMLEPKTFTINLTHESPVLLLNSACGLAKIYFKYYSDQAGAWDDLSVLGSVLLHLWRNWRYKSIARSIKHILSWRYTFC